MTIKAIKPFEKETVSAPVENTSSTETPNQFNSSASPISTDALLTLIASMQQQLLASQQAAVEANAKLAEAILETTKPREVLKSKSELAKEANEKKIDEAAKELKRRQRANLLYNQDNCDHIAGCNELSEQRDIAGRTSIIWHRNDVGVDIGICTNCQRIFHPTDTVDSRGNSYTYWRKKPSFNKLSAAGHRTMQNPQQAMDESYLHDLE